MEPVPEEGAPNEVVSGAQNELLDIVHFGFIVR